MQLTFRPVETLGLADRHRPEPLITGSAAGEVRHPVIDQPLRLTELDERTPGLRRVAHGYATSGGLIRMFGRGFSVVVELLVALMRDMVRACRHGRASLSRMEDGVDRQADAKSIVLYVHYSASGQISRMVQDQLGALARSGFAIIFISMARQIPEPDWQAVRRLCALVVQRPNFGRDFGAWRDLMPHVGRRWPDTPELLLMNDSVLGPIHPLEPVFAVLRAGQDGLFGLTESVQGGAHLQSYLLLARGRPAVLDLMQFIQTLYVSHSKWLLVQLGEIRLARWMRRRGHRIFALFGYDRLIAAALSDPEERARLSLSHARLRELPRLPPSRAATLLYTWPLNPTQHLWHLLATRFGYPFLKTELVVRNPGNLPGVLDWQQVVPASSPCSLEALEAHVEMVRTARRN